MSFALSVSCSSYCNFCSSNGTCHSTGCSSSYSIYNVTSKVCEGKACSNSFEILSKLLYVYNFKIKCTKPVWVLQELLL